jgi:hypothetical protein
MKYVTENKVVPAENIEFGEMFLYCGRVYIMGKMNPNAAAITCMRLAMDLESGLIYPFEGQAVTPIEQIGELRVKAEA